MGAQANCMQPRTKQRCGGNTASNAVLQARPSPVRRPGRKEGVRRTRNERPAGVRARPRRRNSARRTVHPRTWPIDRPPPAAQPNGHKRGCTAKGADVAEPLQRDRTRTEPVCCGAWCAATHGRLPEPVTSEPRRHKALEPAGLHPSRREFDCRHQWTEGDDCRSGRLNLYCDRGAMPESEAGVQPHLI